MEINHCFCINRITVSSQLHNLLQFLNIVAFLVTLFILTLYLNIVFIPTIQIVLRLQLSKHQLFITLFQNSLLLLSSINIQFLFLFLESMRNLFGLINPFHIFKAALSCQIVQTDLDLLIEIAIFLIIAIQLIELAENINHCILLLIVIFSILNSVKDLQNISDPNIGSIAVFDQQSSYFIIIEWIII